jgi:hypothetical protein
VFLRRWILGLREDVFVIGWILGELEMVELRNKVVSVPAGGWECVISPIGKDGFGGYQLRHKVRERCMIKQLKITTSKQYWEEMTLRISDELKKIGVIMLDCYLVGSGMSNQSLADIDDIDSAMILTGNYSDKELLTIRDILDNLILKVDKFNKYHFRLFDEAGFRNLANYDGYRLFEFQYDNLPFYDTDILFQSRPILNSDNFKMSYLTQLIYDCLMNQEIFEFKIDNKKAENRLKKNFEINYINGIELDVNETNSMLNEFLKVRNNSNQSISQWQKFLSKYYFRMKHEFINKSNRYQLNLKEYLCQ